MRLGGLCSGASSTFFSMAFTTSSSMTTEAAYCSPAVHHAVAHAGDLLQVRQGSLRRVGERLPHELHGGLVVRDLDVARCSRPRAVFWVIFPFSSPIRSTRPRPRLTAGASATPRTSATSCRS